jgi:hypothetical protein
MACACGSKNGSQSAPKSYVVFLPGGGQKAYKTEVEAIAAAKRLGGTWKAR